jgi:hypothetical protein
LKTPAEVVIVDQKMREEMKAGLRREVFEKWAARMVT